MSDRKTPFLLMLALAGSLFASVAHAGGVHWSVNINVPGPVYAEPVYYEPPPVYYAPPPPVYYAPRPVVVYGPPAIVGGSWERHHRHHWREDRGGRDDRRGWGHRDNREHRRGHGDHYGHGR